MPTRYKRQNAKCSLKSCNMGSFHPTSRPKPQTPHTAAYAAIDICALHSIVVYYNICFLFESIYYNCIVGSS